MRVLLFDIDGTLVSVGGAGRRAFERAAIEVFGAESAAALAELRFDGMTDELILRHVCGRVGCVLEGADRLRVFTLYEAALRDELDRAEHRVHAGVPALLAALERAGALLGLGTGNIRSGALAKLARTGLAHHFRFGGFGDDGDSREAILQAALERAGAIVGAVVAPAGAVVIGDTPRDVEAARAIGCRAIGVGTGRFGRGDLLAAGAHRAYASLDEAGVLEALMESDMLPPP